MDKIAPIAFSLLPLKTRAQIPAPRVLEQAHFSRHSASTCGTFCIFHVNQSQSSLSAAVLMALMPDDIILCHEKAIHHPIFHSVCPPRCSAAAFLGLLRPGYAMNIPSLYSCGIDIFGNQKIICPTTHHACTHFKKSEKQTIHENNPPSGNARKISLAAKRKISQNICHGEKK